MAKAGKRIRKAYEGIDSDAVLSLSDAVKAIKAKATAKFDETVDVAVNLNIDPRKADQNIRGLLQLPSGTGKNVRVAVFAKGDKADEAKKAGADVVGSDDLAAAVEKGDVDFDRCIATPDMMPVVGKLGKVLGPKGLMPNPKLGTVTTDVKKAVEAAKAGQIEYRAEKTGIVHAGLGKVSFDDKALLDNMTVFLRAVMRARPASVKGTYVKKITLSSTMGPSFKLDLAELGQLS